MYTSARIHLGGPPANLALSNKPAEMEMPEHNARFRDVSN